MELDIETRLIDGIDLCILLKTLGLGVDTETKIVEVVTLGRSSSTAFETHALIAQRTICSTAVLVQIGLSER